jgi:hypothetical protein
VSAEQGAEGYQVGRAEGDAEGTVLGDPPRRLGKEDRPHSHFKASSALHVL